MTPKTAQRVGGPSLRWSGNCIGRWDFKRVWRTGKISTRWSYKAFHMRKAVGVGNQSDY
jgi:hypothetical protein